MVLPANAGDVTSMVKCPPPPLTSACELGICRSMASRNASTTEPLKSVGCDDMPASLVSVPWHRGIHQLRPRVDAALQVEDIPETFTEQLLARLLAADSMVAVQGDRRVKVEPEQVLLTCRIEGPRRRNPGDRSLVLGSDVKERDLVSIEHGLELRRAQLLHLSRLVRLVDLTP